MDCLKYELFRSVSMIWQSIAKYSVVAVISGPEIYVNIR
jgi:hypothetical protein